MQLVGVILLGDRPGQFAGEAVGIAANAGPLREGRLNIETNTHARYTTPPRPPGQDEGASGFVGGLCMGLNTGTLASGID